MQITKSGGFACVETVDGKYLYYTQVRAPIGSLWKMPVEGGEPTKIAEGLSSSNFAVTGRGLYYMSQPDTRSDTKLVQFVSFADNKTEEVALSNREFTKGSAFRPMSAGCCMHQMDEVAAT